MQLKKLLTGVKYTIISGNININIKHISYDSHNIVNSSLFICIKGSKKDGHLFADDAIKNGASAILLDDLRNIDIKKNICYVKVDNTCEILSNVANQFYNVFSDKLTYTAITGTNGKTTTANMISYILNYYNYVAGTIGSLDNNVRGKIIDIPKTNPTTPNCIELAQTIKKMSNLSAKHIVMEVSSIALEMQRVKTLHFKVAVFTNLTHDHLDYHITMDNYKKAKLKLFHMCDYAVLNNDDIVSKDIRQIPNIQLITYGINNEADFRAINLCMKNGRMTFDLVFNKNQYNVLLNIPGKFSVYNALASIAASYALGISVENSIKALSYLKGVSGRFETKLCKNGVMAIIDYAHTPDALVNILKATREIAKRNLLLVFGCGGDRDIYKRPLMGEIAITYADYSFITSDNPRTEVPIDIIHQVERGIHDKSKYEIVVDRKQAIYKALSMARSDDIIIIAGKGDEQYQEINYVKYQYSDIETIDEFNSIK